ncbi:unnamed protein product [Rhodiola kirilowii]
MKHCSKSKFLTLLRKSIIDNSQPDACIFSCSDMAHLDTVSVIFQCKWQTSLSEV